MSPDLINGVFETIGGAMVFLHCRAAYTAKKVIGVSKFATVIFTSWGIWNLYYYPSLGQVWSFSGGLVIVTANAFWLSLMWRYRNNT